MTPEALLADYIISKEAIAFERFKHIYYGLHPVSE